MSYSVTGPYTVRCCPSGTMPAKHKSKLLSHLFLPVFLCVPHWMTEGWLAIS